MARHYLLISDNYPHFNGQIYGFLLKIWFSDEFNDNLQFVYR